MACHGTLLWVWDDLRARIWCNCMHASQTAQSAKQEYVGLHLPQSRLSSRSRGVQKTLQFCCLLSLASDSAFAATSKRDASLHIPTAKSVGVLSVPVQLHARFAVIIRGAAESWRGRWCPNRNATCASHAGLHNQLAGFLKDCRVLIVVRQRAFVPACQVWYPGQLCPRPL